MIVKPQTSLRENVQTLVTQLVDLLFPPKCAVCNHGGQVLCSTCLATMPVLTPPYCLHCGSPQGAHGYCPFCSFHPLHINGLRAACRYEEPLRSCIHALKYANQPRLAEPLGQLLAQTYLNARIASEIIHPVPLHKARQQERGYNQSYLLARTCAHLLGLPLSTALVVRARSTPAQVGLTAPQRQQNVRGAFVCPVEAMPTIAGRSILLIDDVSTTGATLEACAAPLFAAGARSIWGLVLARPV